MRPDGDLSFSTHSINRLLVMELLTRVKTPIVAME
jgi:hypothetical protein